MFHFQGRKLQLLIFEFNFNIIYLIENVYLFTVVIGYGQFNPLRPHDALKHHFKSLKTDLIFL